MPLPAALLQRLQKRGIIKSNEQPSTSTAEEKEEVIAENYDDDEDEEKKSDEGGNESDEEPVACNKIPTVAGCPNKTNLYHDCTEYCLKTYGSGKEVPSPTTERKYRNLLRRFPLPNGWQDVWEPGLARYYFWDTNTDEVSWYPPLHPKARVTMSITRMRALLRSDKRKAANDGSDDSLGEESDSDSNATSSDDEEEEPKVTRITEIKMKRQPERKVQKRNDLDPMDPAAYSEDCPRGRWADGLRNEKDGDKAADSTASGPLFQMRPYPSPGEILRMNQKK